RRHPQLLGAEPDGEAGPDSRHRHQYVDPGGSAGRLSRPMRRVLRPPARPHGAECRRRADGQVPGVGAAPARAGAGTVDGRGAEGQGRLHAVAVRHLSRDSRHRRGIARRPRAHARVEPPDARGGDLAQRARPSCGLDCELAIDQARQPHAAERARPRRLPGAARLRTEPAVTPPPLREHSSELRRGSPVEARQTITATDEERLRRQLSATWYVPRGVIGWFSVADHKTIGLRYIATAFGFFIFAGILAGLMRLQLAVPNNHFVGPDLYNQIFTVHGTMMMFLFAVPVMEAMGVYLVPLMVGTRNIAFPRLNAFSYYVYLFGGVMLVITMLMNTAPDVGWFSYVPLAGPDYAPGKRADFWAQLITFTEVAALAVSVELVATIFKSRAPGMSLNRMPLFVWSMLVTALMVIFAMPSIVTCSTFLLLDRLVGTHFYNPAEGGDSLLWQHLFWFFGHPEVYIIFVPALGIVSSIISAFT